MYDILNEPDAFRSWNLEMSRDWLANLGGRERVEKASAASYKYARVALRLVGTTAPHNNVRSFVPIIQNHFKFVLCMYIDFNLLFKNNLVHIAVGLINNITRKFLGSLVRINAHNSL